MNLMVDIIFFVDFCKLKQFKLFLSLLFSHLLKLPACGGTSQSKDIFISSFVTFALENVRTVSDDISVSPSTLFYCMQIERHIIRT